MKINKQHNDDGVYMICPHCKYMPQLKKNGDAKKGHELFINIRVFHDHKIDYNCQVTELGYACPKCGIMFVDLNSFNK